ncbi:hypothetical protein CR513_34213, partial [Mucuna pruriens]
MAPNNLWRFICESRNIIFKKAKYHFLTLSLFFVLPFSSSFFLSPTRSHPHLFNPYIPNTPHPPSTTNHQPHFLFFILHSLFALLLSLAGVITITYSVFHFFYAQHITLLTTIKSISTSFLPLLATTILSQFIIFSISIFYGLLLLLLIHGADLVHLTIPYSSLSPYVIGFFVALPLLLLLTYLIVNWTLVPVIVVVESCWGFEPLRRSARLIRGMKGIALSSFFLYGFFMVTVVLNCIALTAGSNETTRSWVLVVTNWVVIVTQSYFLAVFMLSNIGVNTVLYIHCKANHGENAEEFKKDCVSLDDAKLSNAEECEVDEGNERGGSISLNDLWVLGGDLGVDLLTFEEGSLWNYP